MTEEYENYEEMAEEARRLLHEWDEHKNSEDEGRDDAEGGHREPDPANRGE